MPVTKKSKRFGLYVAGDYSAVTEYEFLDVVYYNGHSWVCKVETVTGTAPPAAGTSNATWQRLADGAPILAANESLFLRRDDANDELPVGAENAMLQVRSGRIGWHEFLGAPSMLVSKLADRNCGGYLVGAVICKDGRIRATGASNFYINGTAPKYTTGLMREIAVHPNETTLPVLPFVQLSHSAYTFAALDSAGQVWTWGNNNEGQLGDGTTTANPFMQRVKGVLAGKVVTKLYTGSGAQSINTFFAVTDAADSKKLYAWGYNGTGVCGNGTTVDRTTPTQCGTLTGIVDVACHSSSIGQVLAVDDTGQLWAWGNQDYFSFGTTGNTTSPAAIAGMTNIGRVFADSYNHATSGRRGRSFAIETDNRTIWCIGTNTYGELGLGDTTTRAGWTGISGLPASDIVDLKMTSLYGTTYLLFANGDVYCCGYNGNGQLGQGDTTNLNTFTKFTGGAAADLEGRCTKIELTCTGTGTSATVYCLRDDGIMFAAGCNGNYQAGDGTNGDRLNLGRVAVGNYGAQLVDMASACVYTLYAIDDEGILYAVGDNGSGQAGQGSAENTDVGALTQVQF